MKAGKIAWNPGLSKTDKDRPPPIQDPSHAELEINVRPGLQAALIVSSHSRNLWMESHALVRRKKNEDRLSVCEELIEDVREGWCSFVRPVDSPSELSWLEPDRSQEREKGVYRFVIRAMHDSHP